MNIRHVLRDNTWQIQCPQCRQFVTIDVDVMNGRTPFPAHLPWVDVDEPTITEPCGYAEIVNWRAACPPTGVSALGPLEA